MRNIILTIVFCTAIIAVAGCGKAQQTPLPTATTNPIPTSAIETAYPGPGNTTPLSPNALQTAYPAGKGNTTTVVIGEIPIAPQEAPEPDAGKASISGALYSYTIKQALPGTGFYLLPAVGADNNQVPSVIVAPDAAKGDIIGRSDDSGIVSMKDVPPGNYYLVVWAPLSWSVAQVSEADTSPLYIKLEAGTRLALGVIYVSWP